MHQGQFRVVVLTGVHQPKGQVTRKPAMSRDQRGNFNEVRSGSDRVDDGQHGLIIDRMATTASARLLSARQRSTKQHCRYTLTTLCRWSPAHLAITPVEIG